MAAKPASDRLVSIDPADGSVVGELPVSRPEEVRSAVERAQAARGAWAALGYEARATALSAALPDLQAAAEELGSLIHREMGKPLKEAIGEARGAAGALENNVEMARRAVADELHVEEGVRTIVRRDPLGVVAVITPWNFPLWMAATLLYPALLTGNTVVHKPSEKTPLAGRRFAEILAQHLPAGVLELLTGAGDVGQALVESDVQMVAFVGSQETGRGIMAACSRSLKRLVLELGGKDPMIVLEGADLDAAADFAANGAFRNAGQVCCSVERVFVERGAAEAFTAKLVERAQGMSVGPLVDDGQRQKVSRLVDAAVRSGARALVGGQPTAERPLAYPPTVLVDVNDSMDIARRETFGPVVSVRTVANADEAVALANATEYGLGATVWGGDAARAEGVAARLDAGMIGVNRGIRGVGDSPWVGARQSGFGFTGSVEGTRSFTQLRTITSAVPA